MGPSTLLLVVVAMAAAMGGCFAQMPIPARTDGFAYGKATAWGEAVVVEAYFDPVCPDSRDAWPPLQKAVQHYGAQRVSVVVHLFPLPYHSNAFIACRSIHTVNKLNASAVYPLLEKFFKYQEAYYNQPTYTKSRETVVAEITNNLVAPVIGEANLAAYKAGFNDSMSDQSTRISFKYGCARGVTGTPYFFVNGIPLGDSGSPVDYDKWISTLDPLVGKM
ncbi:uncharacterized protein LOC100834992 [Brachypodium distachyon]|uniref:DSBA-like thioredoxin domain-containing protein n=1 Tax=Brachypodium distachyon TaxID=15368 RepID=I1IWH1_BRADI|nr:uncharacterized protein LOC100834992 [Brachypodium distachyon]KQJ81952.1 hypothetical protein BRADI_5g04030v3 [Brachypodium distachyon]|eukprot:XP_003581462.1 uncharacterized protein LOC100834992 [Brachypodium distachyon]